MNSSALKIIAAASVVIALVLAAISWRMGHSFATETTKKVEAAAAPAVPQTLVVVAVKPLGANQPIAKDQVQIVPVQVAPSSYFTNIDDVVGRVPLVDIDAGSPVTPRFFKEGNQLAKLIPPGFLAMSMEVNEVVGVGGFLRPGDVVDVLLYLRDAEVNTGAKRSNANDRDPVPSQARILLKNALVLGYEERIVDRPQGLKEDEKQQAARQNRRKTAVVAVPENDITRVALGLSAGEIRLALHGQQAPNGEEASPTSPGGLPLVAGATASPASSKPGDKPAEQRPDGVITQAELAQVVPKAKKAAAARSAVVVYMGNKRETIYP